MTLAEKGIYKTIPSRIDQSQILNILYHISNEGKSKLYFIALKSISEEDDKEISDWLGMTEKTYRNYRNEDRAVKSNLMEHLVMLISLFKHGIEVFGTSHQFKKWLTTSNFYFGNKEPENYIDTVSGIKFIDDRLTGIEFGDNA
nr:MbcA/ParS/Xre antitoxin family protein [uncultured Fluviicola sp.]